VTGDQDPNADADADADSEPEPEPGSGSTPDREPPVPASRPPGYDAEDPYEGEDLSTYPEWWRSAVERFRAHGMRPYRPPRFADGELVPPTVADLESDLGASVDLRSVEAGPHPEWALWVDGERVSRIDRRRESDGHTVYGLDREEFEALVRGAVRE